MSINRVILIGRLTRDPELRFTQSGTAFATFGLAVDRQNRKKLDEEGKQSVDFFDVIAWGKRAEFVGDYLSKGRAIGVEGRLQQRSWEAEDGGKRSKVEVVADNIHFIGPKTEGAGSPKEADDLGGGPIDDDIPF